MSYSSEVLADSPWGYWKLDESTGATTATDSSGNARHGTYGVELLQQAAIVPALADTSVDYGNAADNTAWGPPGTVIPAFNMGDGRDWSFEFWAKALVRADGSTGMSQTTGPLRDSTGSRDFNFFAKRLRYFDGGDRVVASVDFNLNEIAHYVITFTDSSNTWKLYRDGASDTGISTSGAPGSTTRNFDTLGISSSTTSHQSNRSQIRMSHVAVYTSVLSAARVLAHYNAGTGGGAAPAVQPSLGLTGVGS